MMSRNNGLGLVSTHRAASAGDNAILPLKFVAAKIFTYVSAASSRPTWKFRVGLAKVDEVCLAEAEDLFSLGEPCDH